MQNYHRYRHPPEYKVHCFFLPQEFALQQAETLVSWKIRLLGQNRPRGIMTLKQEITQTNENGGNYWWVLVNPNMDNLKSQVIRSSVEITLLSLQC